MITCLELADFVEFFPDPLAVLSAALAVLVAGVSWDEADLTRSLADTLRARQGSATVLERMTLLFQAGTF